jgi:5'-nucleotidase
MKVLLTNDDGIDAPGLSALRDAVRDLGAATVVAPADAHSGCSHQITTNAPLRVEERRPAAYAVHGTPADCVRVGLYALAAECDWVVAGINHGGNLGADVYVSGTVAAVREAVLHGKPGVAVSYYKRKELDFDWPRAARWVTPVLRAIFADEWRPGVFWNVNLPHLSPDDPDPVAVHCRLDPAPLPVGYREEGGLYHYDGNYHGRTRTPGCDVDVCFSGRIAVTRLNLFD